MNQLKKQVESCKKCSLYKSRTQVVFGDGDIKANVMIIGEAPGKNEDEQGLPFVGKAGKYLEELLSLADLKRSDVYIANVIKCRPPSNRDPYAKEVNECCKYLSEQIKTVNPKIIVTLGNFATRYILKTKEGITSLHGKSQKLDDYIVYPVYHPASTMYDIKKKQALEKDFKLLKRLL